MTYLELAEVHRKLADNYVYVDKLLEFKDHYQHKSTTLETDLTRIKEERQAQVQVLQDHVNTLQELVNIHEINKAEWDALIDDRNAQISELIDENIDYETLILKFSSNDIIPTLIALLESSMEVKNKKGLEVLVETKAIQVLESVNYKIAEIRESYDEDEEELAF